MVINRRLEEAFLPLLLFRQLFFTFEYFLLLPESLTHTRKSSLFGPSGALQSIPTGGAREREREIVAPLPGRAREKEDRASLGRIR